MNENQNQIVKGFQKTAKETNSQTTNIPSKAPTMLHLVQNNNSYSNIINNATISIMQPPIILSSINNMPIIPTVSSRNTINTPSNLLQSSNIRTTANSLSSEKTKAKEYLMRMILQCGLVNEQLQTRIPLSSTYSKRNWNDLYSPIEKRTIKTLCPQCEMRPIADKMLALNLFPTKGKIATILSKQLNAKQFDWLCLNKPGICSNYINFNSIEHKQLFHKPLVLNKQIMLYYMRSISFDDDNNDYQKPNFVVSVIGNSDINKQKHEHHKILIKAVKKSTFKRNCQPKCDGSRISPLGDEYEYDACYLQIYTWPPVYLKIYAPSKKQLGCGMDIQWSYATCIPRVFWIRNDAMDLSVAIIAHKMFQGRVIFDLNGDVYDLQQIAGERCSAIQYPMASQLIHRNSMVRKRKLRKTKINRCFKRARMNKETIDENLQNFNISELFSAAVEHISKNPLLSSNITQEELPLLCNDIIQSSYAQHLYNIQSAKMKNQSISASDLQNTNYLSSNMPTTYIASNIPATNYISNIPTANYVSSNIPASILPPLSAFSADFSNVNANVDWLAQFPKNENLNLVTHDQCHHVIRKQAADIANLKLDKMRLEHDQKLIMKQMYIMRHELESLRGGYDMYDVKNKPNTDTNVNTNITNISSNSLILKQEFSPKAMSVQESDQEFLLRLQEFLRNQNFDKFEQITNANAFNSNSNSIDYRYSNINNSRNITDLKIGTVLPISEVFPKNINGEPIPLLPSKINETVNTNFLPSIQALFNDILPVNSAMGDVLSVNEYKQPQMLEMPQLVSVGTSVQDLIQQLMQAREENGDMVVGAKENPKKEN